MDPSCIPGVHMALLREGTLRGTCGRPWGTVVHFKGLNSPVSVSDNFCSWCCAGDPELEGPPCRIFISLLGSCGCQDRGGSPDDQFPQRTHSLAELSGCPWDQTGNPLGARLGIGDSKASWLLGRGLGAPACFSCFTAVQGSAWGGTLRSLGRAENLLPIIWC